MAKIITLRSLSTDPMYVVSEMDFKLGLARLDKRIRINDKWLDTELGIEFASKFQNNHC